MTRLSAFHGAALALAATIAGADVVTVQVTDTPANLFVPALVYIRTGDSVRWVGAGGIHNVFADDGSFNSGPATASLDFTHVFNTPGTFGYYCQPHGSPGSGQFGIVKVSAGRELGHGSDLLDDLAGGSRTLSIGQVGYASYEVVVDSMAGAPQLELQRLDSSGATLQTGAPLSNIDSSQSLRWENVTASPGAGELVRVTSPTCGTSCTSADEFRLRAYETTYAVPRFNTSGTQVTILVLQNPSGYAISGHAYFWSATGTLLGTHPFALASRQALVLNVASVSGVSGSGTLTIAHDGRYGDLAGKTVALEPATGFSFDSPMVPRPR